MRILMSIHHELHRSSGAPGTTLHVADAYRSLGHEVAVWGWERIPLRRHLPTQVHKVAFPFVTSAGAAVRSRSLDVVDASTGDLWPLLVARARGARRGPLLVTQSHGLEHAADSAIRAESAAGHMQLSRIYGVYEGGWRLREVALSLRRADGVLLLNDVDRAYAITQLGVNPERAVVVDNALPSALVGLPPVTQPPRDEVILLGGFSPIKGIAYSVPAIVRVLRERQSARATLLGVGVPADAAVAGFPADVRPRLRVVERYAQGDLAAHLSGAAVAISASVSEGFGNAVLEAMACGVPVVATTAPGPARIITHNRNGVLVPRRDANALADGVLSLLHDPGRQRHLAVTAQADVQRYTWEATARARLAAYDRFRAMRG